MIPPLAILGRSSGGVLRRLPLLNGVPPGRPLRTLPIAFEGGVEHDSRRRHPKAPGGRLNPRPPPPRPIGTRNFGSFRRRR